MMEWSPDLAYCVGLLASDGCLYGDRRHIELCSKDLELVQCVRDLLGPTNRITFKRNGTVPPRWHYRVQIGNVALYGWLVQIGLTPKKSLTLGPLNIPDEFFADFLRGMLDGDGSIRVYDDPAFPRSRRLYVFFYSASPEYLAWLQETIGRLWGLTGYQKDPGPTARLCYAKTASIALLQRIYHRDANNYLMRKYDIAREFLLKESAEVVKLANTRVSEARAERLGGSTPPLRTISFSRMNV